MITQTDKADKAMNDIDQLVERMSLQHEKWLIGTDDDAEMAQEFCMENLPALIAEWRAQKAEIERLRAALTLSADALEGTYGRVEWPATEDCDENVAYLAARKALETD